MEHVQWDKLNQIQNTQKLTISSLYVMLKEEDELRGNKRGTVDTQNSYYTQYVSRFFENADMSSVTIKM